MIYYLLLVHFVGDFIFQHRWMAQNKSHNQFALLSHIFVYSSVLTAGLYYLMPEVVPLSTFIMFIAFNAIAHYATDAVTSKITSFLWDKKQTYLFFCTIGFDQLIHTCTLIFSCRMFLEKLVGKEWLLG
jgi:hypothetical protein